VLNVSSLRGVLMKPVLMALLFVLASLAGCVQSEETTTPDVEAIFDYSPRNDIRVGDTIEFDASASLPQGGSLTYQWDFDNDGSYDESGRTATWEYSSAGSKTVKLAVKDGTTTAYQTRDLTVAAADAAEPIADAGSHSPFSDCDSESVSSGNYYIYYICEMDKSLSSKSVSATTTVNLDGSDSESGDSNDYISEWNWDLDLQRDTDGDGNYKNDADRTGEQVEWKDVAPGEYEVNLSVTNSAGAMDGDKIKVYVSYYGEWKDFQIDGNNSGSPKVIEFDMPVVYDRDQGNTIRKVESILTYPQIDDDCVLGDNQCGNTLNLYAFNEEEEEAANTSDTANENRDEGDCDSENYCVLLLLSSYMFMDTESTWDDGEWMMQIRNNRWNDVQVESMVIILHYK